MKPQFTVHIYTPQELNHSSYVQTGLFELENDGFLKTKVVLSFKKRLGSIHIKNSVVEHINTPHPKTSFYKLINHQNGKTVHFATDLYDASYSFSKYALDHCDFVFKRNYESKYVTQLPDAYQKKLHPLGWCFGVHSTYKKSNLKFYIGLLLSNVLLNIKTDRHFFIRILKTIQQQKKHWKFINTTRNLQSFDRQPTPPENDYIVFQTRCFVHENELALKELHQQRYQIIKLLQQHFPDQFKGGFIPTAIAKQKYNDALTNLPTDPASYLALVKASKIGIYTQGIQDSPAWKMAEYLSQGKVIIAQRFPTELPMPIENLKEVLIFDKIEEIPDLCKKVFSNKQLASDLSANGREYYQLYISPGRNVKRILNLMLTE